MLILNWKPCMTSSHVTYRIEIMRSSQFKFDYFNWNWNVDIHFSLLSNKQIELQTILNVTSLYIKSNGTNSHLKRTNAISKCRSLTAILCSFHCSLVGIACIFHMEFPKQHAKSANFKTNLMWYSRWIHKCARAPIIYFTIFPSLIL